MRRDLEKVIQTLPVQTLPGRRSAFVGTSLLCGQNSNKKKNGMRSRSYYFAAWNVRTLPDTGGERPPRRTALVASELCKQASTVVGSEVLEPGHRWANFLRNVALPYSEGKIYGDELPLTTKTEMFSLKIKVLEDSGRIMTVGSGELKIHLGLIQISNESDEREVDDVGHYVALFPVSSSTAVLVQEELNFEVNYIFTAAHNTWHGMVLSEPSMTFKEQSQGRYKIFTYKTSKRRISAWSKVRWLLTRCEVNLTPTSSLNYTSRPV